MRNLDVDMYAESEISKSGGEEEGDSKRENRKSERPLESVSQPESSSLQADSIDSSRDCLSKTDEEEFRISIRKDRNLRMNAELTSDRDKEYLLQIDNGVQTPYSGKIRVKRNRKAKVTLSATKSLPRKGYSSTSVTTSSSVRRVQPSRSAKVKSMQSFDVKESNEMSSEPIASGSGLDTRKRPSDLGSNRAIKKARKSIKKLSILSAEDTKPMPSKVSKSTESTEKPDSNEDELLADIFLPTKKRSESMQTTYSSHSFVPDRVMSGVDSMANVTHDMNGQVRAEYPIQNRSVVMSQAQRNVHQSKSPSDHKQTKLDLPDSDYEIRLPELQTMRAKMVKRSLTSVTKANDKTASKSLTERLAAQQKLKKRLEHIYKPKMGSDFFKTISPNQAFYRDDRKQNLQSPDKVLNDQLQFNSNDSSICSLATTGSKIRLSSRYNMQYADADAGSANVVSNTSAIKKTVEQTSQPAFDERVVTTGTQKQQQQEQQRFLQPTPQPLQKPPSEPSQQPLSPEQPSLRPMSALSDERIQERRKAQQRQLEFINAISSSRATTINEPQPPPLTSTSSHVVTSKSPDGINKFDFKSAEIIQKSNTLIRTSSPIDTNHAPVVPITWINLVSRDGLANAILVVILLATGESLHLLQVAPFTLSSPPLPALCWFVCDLWLTLELIFCLQLLLDFCRFALPQIFFRKRFFFDQMQLCLCLQIVLAYGLARWTVYASQHKTQGLTSTGHSDFPFPSNVVLSCVVLIVHSLAGLILMPSRRQRLSSVGRVYRVTDHSSTTSSSFESRLAGRSLVENLFILVTPFVTIAPAYGNFRCECYRLPSGVLPLSVLLASFGLYVYVGTRIERNRHYFISRCLQASSASSTVLPPPSSFTSLPSPPSCSPTSLSSSASLSSSTLSSASSGSLSVDPLPPMVVYEYQLVLAVRQPTFFGAFLVVLSVALLSFSIWSLILLLSSVLYLRYRANKQDHIFSRIQPQSYPQYQQKHPYAFLPFIC